MSKEHRYFRLLKPYKPSRVESERIEKAKRQAIHFLSYPHDIEEIVWTLNIIQSHITDASNKWNAPFATKEAIEYVKNFTPGVSEEILQHDHVYTRWQINQELIQNKSDPLKIHMILDKCVGCVLLKSQHEELTYHDGAYRDLSAKIYGWDRYRILNIEVYDRRVFPFKRFL